MAVLIEIQPDSFGFLAVTINPAKNLHLKSSFKILKTITCIERLKGFGSFAFKLATVC